MKVLFDQGTPVPLRSHLKGHAVSTAHELGWSTLENGELLAAAERENFEVFITTDRNLSYQQNLLSRDISIVVLSTTSWPRIQLAIDSVVNAVDASAQNSFVEIEIPYDQN